MKCSLKIDGKNILELARDNPAEAHKLVARAVGLTGHQAFFNFRGRQSCIREAMAKPLPGAAADALINGILKVDGRIIREVVPTYVKCLQALDSPLLKMAERAMDSKDGKSDQEFEENEQWELCYVFTTDPKQLRLNLKEKGVIYLRAEAESLWSNASSATINVTMVAIMNQYARHVATTARFSSEMEASGDVSFFRELREKALRPQASDGSSATSADTANTTPATRMN